MTLQGKHRRSMRNRETGTEMKVLLFQPLPHILHFIYLQYSKVNSEDFLMNRDRSYFILILICNAISSLKTSKINVKQRKGIIMCKIDLFFSFLSSINPSQAQK